MAKRRQKIRNLVVFFICLGLVAGLYLFYLDLKIRTKFEAHRWNLPSRIFSDSYYLYPGQRLSPVALEAKLKRLAYKRVIGPAQNVGEFGRSGPAVSVYLHTFSYPSEEFVGFRTRVLFDEERVKEIENLETGEKLKMLRLEPELIASIFDEKMEDRTVVTLEEIPEELVQSVIAVEDERFFRHRGVDPIAILRALLTDILHLRIVQGGSTLTQQLVKNYFLTAERTVGRKINELIMALLLEGRFSKEEILEAYLNEIYLGQLGAVSIRDKGLITEAEFRKARKERITTAPPARKPLGSPFFVDTLKGQLRESYGDLLASEGLRIFTTLDAEAQETAEGVVERRLQELERSRPAIKKLAAEGKFLEACLIAIDPQTGFIRAYVGGRDYSISQFDRCSMARRQPGSAFKPFVYLTALDETGKWTAASLLEDRSFSVRSGGEEWQPKNYDETEHGTVTLREALEQSYNIATARLAIDIGLDRVVETAKRAGLTTPLDPVPSVALGAFEVVPLELAQAFTLFPNQGILSHPVSWTHLVTRDGVVLEKKSFKMERVITPERAYLMNSLLRGVIERGTGQAVRLLGMTGLAAGKTGTTSDFRDSWFIGYSPQLLTLVWSGYDDGTPSGLSGAAGALPIWADFMKKAAPSGDEDFIATEDILLLKVERASGKRWERRCGESFEEVFIRGTEPRQSCR